MKTLFRKYYLPTFLGGLVTLLLGVIGVKSPNSTLQNVLIILVGALCISLMAGTLYYFQDTRWGPKKREKRFGKPPFTQLLENGFKREGDFVTSIIRQYAVVVMYTWEDAQPAIQMVVFFDSRLVGNSLSTSDIRQIEKKYKKPGFWHNHRFSWFEDSISRPILYNFSPPKYDAVMAVTHHMIDILIAENFKPISLEESKKMALQ